MLGTDHTLEFIRKTRGAPDAHLILGYRKRTMLFALPPKP